MIGSLQRQDWRPGLWSLFLMCAFPLHAWTLILSFRDVAWLTERTNAWDAVGVVSYGLLLAFFESLLIFAVMALLGVLVLPKWDSRRRIALLSVLVLVVSFWAMASQLYFLWKLTLPGSWAGFLIQTGHPLRIMSAAVLLTVSSSFLVPALLMIKSARALHIAQVIIDRLSLLTVFYLFLDAIGLVIVLIRNVSESL